MKGFIRGICSIACVLLIIGIGAAIFGFTLGGRFVTVPLGNTGISLYGGNNLGFMFASDENYSNNYDENIINQDNSYDSTFEQNEDITALDFEIGNANLNIVSGDTFKFESEGENRYTSQVEGKTWKIKLRKTNNFYKDTENITITIPENATFSKVDFEFGAGSFNASNIVTDVLDMEVGAGNFNGSDIVVNTKSSISCGASNIDISGNFKGDNDIECGAGRVVMNFDEEPANYGYQIELGLGHIALFDKSFNGIADKLSNKGADVFFDIECGVGSVEIN